MHFICHAGIQAAESTGADPMLMSYNIMLAASASFMSPFGYTTNLLIYGPGEKVVQRLELMPCIDNISRPLTPPCVLI